ncbi:MAG: hypothetical protein WC789_04525 [Lentisphaeria bacterium]|jgi:hypothetical protein
MPQQPPAWWRPRRLAALAALLLLCPAAARAAAVAPATAAQALPVVKDGVGLAQEIGKVPRDVGEVLLLPMGVVECVAAPLPGVAFLSGLKHLGTGLVAPFKLARDVLTLPYDAATAVGRVAGLAAPVAGGS